MKDPNPFDTKLASNPRMPEGMRGALVEVVDTLDFAWAGVRAVFEKQATPEHALALVELILRRADAQRPPPAGSGAGRRATATKRPPGG